MEGKNIIVLSENEQRNNYIFKYAIQVLNKGIIHYDIKKKQVELFGLTIRFMSYAYFEKYGNFGFRGKTIYAEHLEKELDKLKENNNG